VSAKETDMSSKKAKVERKEEAKATLADDPQALLKGQFALVRLDGAIEGAEAGVKVLEVALKNLQEALGATKANRRALFAEVDKLQKAAQETAKAKGTKVAEGVEEGATEAKGTKATP